MTLKKYEDTVSDVANFSDCMLRLACLPSFAVRELRKRRGRIRSDLGVKCVVTYTLCCRVLARLAHVRSPKKQYGAVCKLEIILTGGMVKKRKHFRRGRGGRQTKDRTMGYIERCIHSYIAGDFGSSFSNYASVDLHDEICKGDDLVEELVSVLQDSPSFSHVLPISVFSLVWLFVEVLTVGKVVTASGVDSETVLQCRGDDLYAALENTTMECLKPLHPASGVVGGGDGRPLFPSSSVHGRDGAISKIALSNVALASALNMGSRMRKPNSRRSGAVHDGNGSFGIDTFFPIMVDALVRSRESGTDYDAIMEAARDFLTTITHHEVALVLKKHLSWFFGAYAALQRCNKVTVSVFKGPGLLFRSRYVPDSVRFHQMQKNDGRSSFVDAMSREIDGDIRISRESKESSMDSPTEVLRTDGTQAIRYVCPVSKDICHLLYNCIKLAERILLRSRRIAARRETVPDLLARFKKIVFRDFMLGMFGCDLSGNVIELYEEYIFSSVMRHFDEREGAVSTLKAASRRRYAVRASRRKGRRAESTPESTDGVTEPCHVGDYAPAMRSGVPQKISRYLTKL